MRSNLSDNILLYSLSLTGAALSVVACVAAAMPLSVIAAAAGGALFLFSFTIAEKNAGNHISHPFVSGKTSRALLIVTAAFAVAGTHPAAAVSAAVIFIVFELAAEILFRNVSPFFAGIVSHAVLAVFSFFLVTKGHLRIASLLSAAVSPLQDALLLPALSVPFMLAALAVLPRLAEKISPISRETFPVTFRRVTRGLDAVRVLSFIAAFLLCGAVLMPFEFLSRKKTVFAASAAVVIYVSIAVISAAAVRKGFAAEVLASVAVISYLRFILSVRRTHAGYKRTFIHGQRNSRS